MVMLFKNPVRDRVALSFISGILGTIVMYCVGIPLYFLKLSSLIYLLYDIELFVTPSISRTIPGFLSGALVGLIVGGGLALGFKLIVEWTGSDWIWLKSAAYAFAIWFFWVGIARNLMDITPYLYKDLRTNMILLIQSFIFQFATTYFMINLAGGQSWIERPEK